MANQNCAGCDSVAELRCSRCLTALYCSPACQNQHLSMHTTSCFRAWVSPNHRETCHLPSRDCSLVLLLNASELPRLIFCIHRLNEELALCLKSSRTCFYFALTGCVGSSYFVGCAKCLRSSLETNPYAFEQQAPHPTYRSGQSTALGHFEAI